MGALATAIENGCGFVGAANLDFLEKGALTAASDRGVRALDRGCTRVFEGLGASKHIVDFLPLKVHLALELLLYAVNVGTGAAEEPHVVARLLRQQNVGARGAKKHSNRCV